MFYGKLHNYETGAFLREATREDWLQAQKVGQDRHTGAHLGVEGFTVWIEDAPQDPSGPLSPREAMNQFLEFAQRDPGVSACFLKGLFVRVTSANPLKGWEVLVEFVTRGNRRNGTCGAIEICGNADLKTTHFLTRSPQWRERAMARIKLVGGF